MIYVVVGQCRSSLITIAGPTALIGEGPRVLEFIAGGCFLFHLAVLCDSLRCGAHGTFCYGIS